MTEEKYDVDIIDTDLYEDLDAETMLEIIEQERKDMKQKKNADSVKKPNVFPRWIFWLMTGALLLNLVAIIPQTFSIPAIDFLITSARLSGDPVVQLQKEAVVVIGTSDSKGTGFAISADGFVVTNYHVIEGEERVTVAFPEEGLFTGEVIETAPEVDLALIKVDGDDLPYLLLAEGSSFTEHKPISFIGNPLRFNGIANEGVWIGTTNQTRLDADVMMLDAPIYRGNSGSPVINANGEVIGVIYATLNHDNHGKIGLAIPIEQFHQIFKQK